MPFLPNIIGLLNHNEVELRGRQFGQQQLCRDLFDNRVQIAFGLFRQLRECTVIAVLRRGRGSLQPRAIDVLMKVILRFCAGIDCL